MNCETKKLEKTDNLKVIALRINKILSERFINPFDIFEEPRYSIHSYRMHRQSGQCDTKTKMNE